MSQNEQWDIVTSVGATALAVAGGRAIESRRPDRLIEDQYAEMLVRAASGPLSIPGEATADDQLPDEWKEMAAYLAVRTRFFDHYFTGATEDGLRQAVILASGLDTRAFRLKWPEGTRVFEIDQPLVLQFKDSTLASNQVSAACDRRAVAVDLRDDWATALTSAGFDSSAPTAWLAEGLLPYLPAAAEARLLEAVHALSASGSRIAVESVGDAREQLMDPQMRELSQKWGLDFNELFSGEERPDPKDVLTEKGWRTETRASRALAEEYGRPMSPFAQQLIGERSQLLTAELG